MQYSNVCLHTFGYSLPPNIISSTDIEHQLSPVYERLKLPQGRLELMSGIKERRFWNSGTKPSDAATLAGTEVLKKGNINPGEIECLIFTSVSRDMMEPATASFVHDNLNLNKNCLIFDISNACLGFLDGIIMLANMIELGQVRNGLIVSGETAEELVQSTIDNLIANKNLTRKSIKPSFASLTIGSGAVGLYMTNRVHNKPQLINGCWRANTRHSRLCQGDNSGQATTLMDTNSEELLIRGIETAADTWNEFSKNSGWGQDDLDIFCCHQVGSAHAKLLFDSLQLDPKKNFETLAYLGNIGSVSAPVTMAIAIEKQKFTPGNKCALLGIGSGINCMMLGVKW